MSWQRCANYEVDGKGFGRVIDLEDTLNRWFRVREVMVDRDLDAVLAIDLSRDEILLGHQRWLTGYIPVGGPAAAILQRDGHVELISERIGKPSSDFYTTNLFPIDIVHGFSIRLLVERVVRLAPKRVGIAEMETLSFALAAGLQDILPDLEIVDISNEFQKLRLHKSAHEVTLIRKSCAIADTVWERIPEIFRIGRRQAEIVADVDHLVRSSGAEGGFHLVLPIPFLGRSIQSLANPDRIERNARYLMEISPRFQGYYSQLTIPVTSHANDDIAMRAYDDLVAAKRAAQPMMRPGADLSQIAVFIKTFLADRQHSMTGLSLGHFCGMALEEPRHDPSIPFILQEGMTLIFHPAIGDLEIRSLMRADTYLIAADGAERLNRYEGSILNIV
jgi:Xaa-Pro aminopeptidase